MSDKPSKHVVKSGEQHVARVAFDHGLRGINPIWDAPENAELRRLRVNPNTLAANDVVVIPADDPKTEPRSTQQVNVFTVANDRLHLVLRLQDEARRPFANRAFHFVAGTRTGVGVAKQKLQTPIDFTTDADGQLNVFLAIRATEAELTLKATNDTPPLPEIRIRMLIGALDPVDTASGQRSRLNNLGYFAGFTANDTAQLQWAIEEFQQDHKLKVNGRTDDDVMFNKLAHEHGDLLASETVPAQ